MRGQQQGLIVGGERETEREQKTLIDLKRIFMLYDNTRSSSIAIYRPEALIICPVCPVLT